MNQLLEKGINSILASSCGRLFDAVAAAIGICREECSYEGQAAIEMEAIVDIDSLNYFDKVLPYPFTISNINNLLYIEARLMWQAILNDLKHNIPKGVIAAKFHQGLVIVIITMAKQLCEQHGINQVVLTGGVFQNRILLEQVSSRLKAMKISVLTHSLVPPNDGGLSLGQAVIASAQYIK